MHYIHVLFMNSIYLYVYDPRRTLGWWMVLGLFAAGAGITYMRTLDSSPFGLVTCKINATYDYVIGNTWTSFHTLNLIRVQCIQCVHEYQLTDIIYSSLLPIKLQSVEAKFILSVRYCCYQFCIFIFLSSGGRVSY